MPPNHKLTNLIRGWTVERSTSEAGKYVITFTDGSALTSAGRCSGDSRFSNSLLAEFYRLAINQAQRSLRWALIAAGVGLLFFLAAVVFLIKQKEQSVATISLVSGALIEVISAINFYLYARTSAQLAEFHARLETTQRFLLRRKIVVVLDFAPCWNRTSNPAITYEVTNEMAERVRARVRL